MMLGRVIANISPENHGATVVKTPPKMELIFTIKGVIRQR